MKRRIGLFFVLSLFLSSCNKIKDAFSPRENQTEYFTKEEVEAEINKVREESEEEIERIRRLLETSTYSKYEIVEIIKEALNTTYSREEILDIIKEALSSTYSSEEIDHIVNNLEGERVVESWRQDYNYYRVYSDGWIEQGGRVTVNECTTTTVTLFKEMKDNKYSIMVINNRCHTYKDAEGVLTAFSNSDVNIGRKSFYITAGYINPNSGFAMWEVKGFMYPDDKQEASNDE